VLKRMNDGPQQQESNPLNDKETHQIGPKNMIYVIGLSFHCLVTMVKT
jgi:hypothetical protein